MNSASAPDFHFSALLLYCRPGFEKECAQEIAAACTGQSVSGTVRSKPDAGYVEFVLQDSDTGARLRSHLRFGHLIFARQLIYAIPWIRDLPVTDRVGALLPAIAAIGTPFSAVWLETADTNEAKELGAFCRKFLAPLSFALKKAALLREGDGRSAAAASVFRRIDDGLHRTLRPGQRLAVDDGRAALGAAPARAFALDAKARRSPASVADARGGQALAA